MRLSTIATGAAQEERPKQSQETPGTLVADTTSWAVSRVDIRNVCILLGIFGIVLLVVAPGRSYPMDDDWAYAQSVRDLLQGHYLPHEWTQPTALGHLVWGALFSSLFGYNFTVLTAATLFMSACCLVVFYLLMRQLRVSPKGALLGTALLGLNPMYVYLSYSFMTDISFMTYLMLACLGYVKGLQEMQEVRSKNSDNERGTSGEWWLLLGALATGLAYLTRQIGVLLVFPVLGYVWWAGKWSWRRAVIIAAIPLGITAAYMIWERTLPPRLLDIYLRQLEDQALADPLKYVVDHTQDLSRMLPMAGLSLFPLLLWQLPRRPLFITPFLALFVSFAYRAELIWGSAFFPNGSVVDQTGDFSCCKMAPVWNEQVWFLIAVSGLLAFCLYAVSLGEEAVRGVRGLLRRTTVTDSVVPLYAFGLILFASVIVLSPFLFDRYILPILPFMMIPALRRVGSGTAVPVLDKRPRSMLAVSWLLVVPLAVFGILAQHDYMARAQVRWEAAEALVAEGISPNRIYAGFEWVGWNLFQQGVEYITRTHDLRNIRFPAESLLDPAYAIIPAPEGRYLHILGSRPYQTWLEMGTTQRLFVIERQP